MNAEAVREWLVRQPFEPFEVRLSMERSTKPGTPSWLPSDGTKWWWLIPIPTASHTSRWCTSTVSKPCKWLDFQVEGGKERPTPGTRPGHPGSRHHPIFDWRLLGEFEERVEAHVVVGIGALAFVLQKMLPLFAVHLLQKALRAAEQAEPLQR